MLDFPLSGCSRLWGKDNSDNFMYLMGFEITHISVTVPQGQQWSGATFGLGVITYLAGQGFSPSRIHPITNRLASERADKVCPETRSSGTFRITR